MVTRGLKRPKRPRRMASRNARLGSDADCLDYIFQQRWPDGGTCVRCGRKDCFHRVSGRRAYACAWCGFQLYPTAGTIFHKSTTSLESWFDAMFLMSASRGGVPARELERQLGVTYKCAHRMAKQIRRLMNEKPALLTGIVKARRATLTGGERGGNKRGGAKRALKSGRKLSVKAARELLRKFPATQPNQSAPPASSAMNECSTTRPLEAFCIEPLPSCGCAQI